ncbi:efflux RND transporter periplasmic adaptor subunit [Pseudomonas sp.]|uniref:efflux RND transporter periplasmic adaptor subunit n=1 Tax=Pseudomonas sp. TaxID=306 RepID=UPI00272AC2F4|nr:efflux RND transporter periplasmic adaptor subunit [Pseudomonas sp.]
MTAADRGPRPSSYFLAWVAAAVLLVGCGGADEVADPPPRVALVEPLQRVEPAPELLRFAGVVESVSASQLAFQVPGRIERILVEEGAQVSRGQPLAELDDTDYQLQLREAAAQFNQLQADLQRKRELLEEGILSPAAIEPLEAAMISARVARDAAQRNIGHSTLEAPFDGVIARRMAEPNMVIDAGMPIFQLRDQRQVEVGVDLTERAALTLPLGPELQAQGELVIAELQLPLMYKEHATQPEPGSRTYRLILRGDPPEGVNLLPGMAMHVTLQMPSPQQDEPAGFLLPLAALQTGSDGRHFAWIAEDGHARRRDLDVRQLGEGQAVVSGQFNAGDQVVVAGASKLFEGQPIQPRTRD